ncbi:MAG: aromatic amino acid ammonia-lyase, partial [Nocardiopsaceae bacterium]|nr:aromatic amino acid ammonia-lyase [Nocardiopsaceae bacterium]
MTVIVDTSGDLTLESVHKISREGASCALSEAALGRVARRREEFLAFVRHNEGRRLYGITTKHHVGAKTLLDAASRDEFARRLPPTPSGFGEPLPQTLTRAIVACRLADVLNGTACLRPGTAARLVALLDGPLPAVPRLGHGEAGDITALAHLFRPAFEGTLALGEGMALINGSPAGTAALADAVLDGRHRIGTVERALSLAAIAARVPAGHYAAPLERAWGDPFQGQALSSMRALINGAGDYEQLPHQAPASFRTSPRTAGWLRRVQAQAEDAASVALRASSNNPVFVGPDDDHPHGCVLSNGGFNSALVSPTLDALARSWADLCQLVTAQVNRLVEDPAGLPGSEPESQVSLFFFAAAGLAEEARTAATTTLMGISTGQSDTSTHDLLAWRKASQAGRALDHELALLLVVAAHTLARSDRPLPGGVIGSLTSDVLAAFPVGTPPAEFGQALARVTRTMSPPA